MYARILLFLFSEANICTEDIKFVCYFQFIWDLVSTIKEDIFLKNVIGLFFTLDNFVLGWR